MSKKYVLYKDVAVESNSLWVWLVLFCLQIRSHAQKYFLKVQKNGTGEHVPPPRPKRKSAQPYPQKAPKCGTSDGHVRYG